MKKKGKDEFKVRIQQKFKLLRESKEVGMFRYGQQDTLCSTYEQLCPRRPRQMWCRREKDSPRTKKLSAERSCCGLV